MKRLFSILFVVCAVCIFPKLSLAAGDDVLTCAIFCQGCTGCEAVLKGNCNCGDGEIASYCELTNDPQRQCNEYDNDWSDIEVTCNCVSSGGNTPSTPTSCTVRFCLDDNNNKCTNSPVASTSYTPAPGNSLTTPSYENWKNAGGEPQSGKILKGWSKVLEPKEEDILALGKAATISCNSGDTLFYHPVWGDCDPGKYANKVTCEPCTAGHYCTNGEEHSCPPGRYSTGGLVTSCSLVDANCYTTGTGSTSSCPNPCPANTSSDKGSTSSSYCKCNAGYELNTTTGSCTMCKKGYSKDGVGNEACQVCKENGEYQDKEGQQTCELCTHGYTSECSSDSKKACQKCTPCPATYFCYEGGQETVPAGYYATGCGENPNQNYECIGNALSCTGCTWRKECSAGKFCQNGRQYDVDPGYYAIQCNSDGTGCKTYTQCPAGSYCTGGVKHDCPTNSSSAAGSDSRDDCSCNAGYGGDARTGSCTICSAGYYKSAGNGSCQMCGSGKYQDEQGKDSCEPVTAGNYAIKCREGKNIDNDKNCIGADCQGCQDQEECPSAGTRFYCEDGQRLKCDENKQLTGCTDDHRCTGCDGCGAGKTVDDTGTGCTLCPAGYKCPEGYKQACKAIDGKYQQNKQQTDCQDIPNGWYCDKTYDEGCTHIAECPPGHYCKGGKMTECTAGTYSAGGVVVECTPCPAGSYSKDNKAIKCTACESGKYQKLPGQISCTPVSLGYYATGCGTSHNYACDFNVNVENCTGCTGVDTCPAINNEGKGYYCTSGQKKECNAGSYLNSCISDGSTGCQECKSCPGGTGFAGTVVVGVGKCGLQTCEYYYEHSSIKDTLGDDWLEKRTDCGADICYMAPTMKMGNQEVDAGKGTTPKCCSSGTLGKCFHENGKESCLAACTGCRTATGAVCDEGDDDEFPDDSHTCPGVQDVGKSDTCTATATGGSCYCPINLNLIRCKMYQGISIAANKDDVCYKDEDGKDRSNYCVDVCYQSCDIPCTKQCPNMANVHSCTETVEKKYTGRKYIHKNNSQCTYYNDSGTIGNVPNCPNFDFTCAANYYYESESNKCKECLRGYHTPAGRKETTCTPNVYKVTLNRGDKSNGDGTSEFFYKYMTTTGSCSYYTSENVSPSTCLQEVQKPTRKGYTFAGYYTAAGGKGEQYVDNAGKIIKDIYKELDGKTLYAKWTPKQFTVTFNTNGAAGAAVPPSTTCKYDDYNGDDPCTAANQGTMLNDLHVFKGWKHNGNGKSYNAGVKFGENISTGDNITLYAIWEKCTACDTSSPGSNCTLTVDDNKCKYTNSCDEGYTAVDGTMETNNNKPECTPNVYEVTLDRAGGSGGTANYFYQYNTKGTCYYYTSDDLSNCIGGTGGVQIDNPTRTGYTFDGYYTEAGGGGTQYVNKDGTTIGSIYKTIGDKKLFAKWNANEYHAIYSCNGGVVNPTPAPDPDTVVFDDDYEVDNTNRGCSKTGSLFQGWQGTNNGTTISAPYKGEPKTKFTWKQAGDITFTAQWKDCPAGYYCGDGIAEQNACPVGSTNGGGAVVITDCYLLGGQSKICSKIGNEEKKCFPLPAGVKVNYSGDWVSPAE